MSHDGVLVVISGFSGSGKGTVIRQLVSKEGYSLSVSATSREPREGEEDGREYFFLTREKFRCMIKSGQLIEWTEYVGNYYGTPREYVETKLAEGQNVVLEIDVEGALHVRELYPDALLLFLTPPSAGELRSRLVGRGTETDEMIARRLARACEEADFMERYDYVIVNDALDECVEEIHRIIAGERLRPFRQAGLIQELRQGLRDFGKGE